MGATPTMNRSAKDGARSSPHYGGEGVTHSPIVPRCLLTARYGRFMRDPHNSRDQQWRIESGPGKDVRERIEAGYVEIDEQEASRWKIPFVKNPNVTLRGDYPIIWSSKV